MACLDGYVYLMQCYCSLKQILKVDYVVPRGPQENDGKLGAVVTFEWATETLLPGTKYLLFKIGSEVCLCSVYLPAQKTKVVFYCFFRHLIWLNLFCIRVTYLLSKMRTRLDFVNRDDHGLSLTTLQPEVKKTCSCLPGPSKT